MFRNQLTVTDLVRTTCPKQLNKALKAEIKKPEIDVKRLDLEKDEDRGTLLHYTIDSIIKRKHFEKLDEETTKMAYRYISTMIPIDATELKSEYEVSFKTSDERVDAEIIGYVDCVFYNSSGLLTVIDWKSPGSWSESYIKQIKMYTALVMQKLGVEKAEYIIFNDSIAHRNCMYTTEKNALLNSIGQVLLDSIYGIPSTLRSDCLNCKAICDEVDSKAQYIKTHSLKDIEREFALTVQTRYNQQHSTSLYEKHTEWTTTKTTFNDRDPELLKLAEERYKALGETPKIKSVTTEEIERLSPGSSGRFKTKTRTEKIKIDPYDIFK